MKIAGLFTLWVLLFSTTVFAQTEIVPIVELKFRGLMGGVQNGKWIAPTKVRTGLPSETEFVLVGWNGVEEGGVSLAKKGEQEDVCEDFTRFEFELKQDHGVAIASTAKWNPVPRLPRAISTSNATYRAVVSNFLKRKGIARPVVRIKQAYRVDLEGDGVQEVLIAATYYRKGLSSSAAVGDYSFVMLRKAVGKVVTDHLLEGDFVLKKIDFGAPTENHISAIADLNGDGKMEIVLYGFYYEGDFASAFEMKNGKPVKIKEFEIGCGV
jgi:hypothetical protein